MLSFLFHIAPAVAYISYSTMYIIYPPWSLSIPKIVHNSNLFLLLRFLTMFVVVLTRALKQDNVMFFPGILFERIRDVVSISKQTKPHKQCYLGGFKSTMNIIYHGRHSDFVMHSGHQYVQWSCHVIKYYAKCIPIRLLYVCLILNYYYYTYSNGFTIHWNFLFSLSRGCIIPLLFSWLTTHC